MIRVRIRKDSVNTMDRHPFKTAKAQMSLRLPVKTCRTKLLGGSSFAATDSRFGSRTDRPLNCNI